MIDLCLTPKAPYKAHGPFWMGTYPLSRTPGYATSSQSRYRSERPSRQAKCGQHFDATEWRGGTRTVNQHRSERYWPSRRSQ
jgi:hypothetical protein